MDTAVVGSNPTHQPSSVLLTEIAFRFQAGRNAAHEQVTCGVTFLTQCWSPNTATLVPDLPPTR